MTEAELPQANVGANHGRLLRALLWLAGALSLLLAVIGVLLPVVPTVPFLLVTAACWARASPRWHRWLLTRPRIGPVIARWERERTVPRAAKWSALGLLAVSLGSTTVLLRHHDWLPYVVPVVALVLAWWILRLPEPGSRRPE